MLLNSAFAAPVTGLDLCSMLPVFMEEFDTESIASHNLGLARWTAHTPWNGDFGEATFVDPGPGGPFAVSGGMLSITARKGVDGKWRSGLIAAADGSGTGEAVRYGYFESRMKLPPGPGTWPSFWLSTLRPANATGPSVELDVVEYYGHDSAALQSAVHIWYADSQRSRHQVHETDIPAGSLLERFHTFGVRVAADVITFYLDRSAIWQVETPSELQLPLFPLVDLALGSGFPIDKTPSPSVMFVDYVHVYALASTSKPNSCPIGAK